MKRYLLSVYQPDGDPPASVDLEQIMRDVNTVNQEMKAAGAWVFSDGLHQPSTATVVRLEQRRRAHHGRPLRRGQGASGRLDDRRRPRSRCRLGVGPEARSGNHVADRGTSVPGGVPRRCRSLMPPRSTECSASSTVAPWPSWCARSVTSTSPRRPSRTHSPSRWSAGRRMASLPARRGGSSPLPETERSTGCGVRPPATTATPRQP